MSPRKHRGIDLTVEPPTRWYPFAGEWIADFKWACGEPARMHIGIDPACDRDVEQRMDKQLRDAEKRDCPDCRKNEMNWEPPPLGHTPRHTHRRFLQGNAAIDLGLLNNAEAAILDCYERSIAPREMTIDEAIETTQEIISLLKERLTALYDDQRRLERRAQERIKARR